MLTVALEQLLHVAPRIRTERASILQDISSRTWCAARTALENLEEGRAFEPGSQRQRKPWRSICAAVAIATLAVAAGWFLKPASQPDRPLIQFDVLPPEGVRFNSEWNSVSPDGTRIALWGTNRDGKETMFMRYMDSGVVVPVQGTEGGSRPFWSPDSLWIAFSANGTLLKIKATGGQPQVICGATHNWGSWGSNGIILYGERDKPIQRVAESGGMPRNAVGFDKDREEFTHGLAFFLQMAGTSSTAATAGSVGIETFASLDSSTRRQLSLNPNSPVWFATDVRLHCMRNNLALWPPAGLHKTHFRRIYVTLERRFTSLEIPFRAELPRRGAWGR